MRWDKTRGASHLLPMAPAPPTPPPSLEDRKPESLTASPAAACSPPVRVEATRLEAPAATALKVLTLIDSVGEGHGEKLLWQTEVDKRWGRSGLGEGTDERGRARKDMRCGRRKGRVARVRIAGEGKQAEPRVLLAVGRQNREGGGVVRAGESQGRTRRGPNL